MIVPFVAGGGADIVGRLIAQKVSEDWGEQIVVENRAGASGNIGAAFVAKSEPDGYTLLFTGPNHSTNVSLYDNLPYDPVRDFTPVALLTSAPYILVSNPEFPARSVGDLIRLARAQPGQIAYGSAGNGTAGHLAMDLLKSTAGIDMIHVPLLNKKFVAALHAPEVTARLAAMNIELTGGTPTQFAEFLRADIAKWARVIKASGARPD